MGYDNIVIVGASAAGAYVARSLEKSLPTSHRIILIERLDYMYHPISALRGSVVAGKEHLSFADLDRFFGQDSRHVVLQATSVTALSPSSVTISSTFEGSDTIPFERAVLALGSSYPVPGRPSSTSKAEAIEDQRRIQRDVAAATSVLIVGGGPVGVEFAGELRSVDRQKKVQLVTSGQTLLQGPFKPSLQKSLLEGLARIDVPVRFNAKVDLPSDVKTLELLPQQRSFSLSDGTEVEADLVMIATGARPNTSLLIESGFSRALDDEKRIKVDAKTLRVLDEGLQNYYSLGDCANAPGTKTHVAAKFQAPVVASQLLSDLGGARAKVYSAPPSIMVVPLGTSAGASQLFGLVL